MLLTVKKCYGAEFWRHWKWQFSDGKKKRRLFRYALELHNNLTFKVFVDLKENCHLLLEAMTVVTCKWVHTMCSYFSALVTAQNLAGYFGIYEHKVSQQTISMNLSSVTCISQSMLFTKMLYVLLPHQRGLQFKSQTPIPAYWSNDRICGCNR